MLPLKRLLLKVFAVPAHEGFVFLVHDFQRDTDPLSIKAAISIDATKIRNLPHWPAIVNCNLFPETLLLGLYPTSSLTPCLRFR